MLAIPSLLQDIPLEITMSFPSLYLPLPFPSQTQPKSLPASQHSHFARGPAPPALMQIPGRSLRGSRGRPAPPCRQRPQHGSGGHQISIHFQDGLAQMQYMHNPHSRDMQYLGCLLTPLFHVTKPLVKTHISAAGILGPKPHSPGMAFQVTLFK